MDTLRNDEMDNTRANTIPAEQTTDHHDSEGDMGEVAGTGAGAISGGVVGAAIGGPIGAVVGAVAGGVLGAKGGEVAHKVGDDHDDVNLSTNSEGEVGRDAGAGAGAISGAVIGTAGGPVGSVVGAVAGGMLGAAAGDAAKHMGENTINRETSASTPTVVVTPVQTVPVVGSVVTPTHGHTSVLADDIVGNGVSGVQTGGHAIDGTPDTRGIMEKTADSVTGDHLDDKTGKIV